MSTYKIFYRCNVNETTSPKAIMRRKAFCESCRGVMREEYRIRPIARRAAAKVAAALHRSENMTMYHQGKQHVVRNGINQARHKWLSWVLAIGTWVVVNLTLAYAMGRFG